MKTDAATVVIVGAVLVVAGYLGVNMLLAEVEKRAHTEAYEGAHQAVADHPLGEAAEMGNQLVAGFNNWLGGFTSEE
jgi:hypothetical protein